MNLQRTLIEYFGHAAFRGGQEEIVRSVATGTNTLVVMPTGAGKSLCYQLPAIAMGGTTLVVSPLIALMKDQVDALTRKKIAATCINSTLSVEERRERERGLTQGRWTLVYVAPERFTPRFLRLLLSARLSLLAVDEAHCMSQWGHDFRPDYLRLGEVRKVLGFPPTVALTATATPEAQEDIVRVLGLEPCRRFVTGFDRKNIALQVIHCDSPEQKLNHVRDLALPGPSLVYCATRKNVERVTRALRDAGIAAGMYHGGLEHADRSKVQEAFLENRVRIIVSTNAFGMGVDKPDIRGVVHHDFPRTLEAYYQEIGRAGRDNEPSRAILLFHRGDRGIQEFFIRSAHPPVEQVQIVWQGLQNARRAVEEQAPGLTKDPDEGGRSLAFLSDQEMNVLFPEEAGGRALCETCLRVLSREGWVRSSMISRRPAYVRLTGDPGSQPLKGLHRMVLEALARSNPSSRDRDLILEAESLAAQLAIDRAQLDAALWFLGERGLVKITRPQALHCYELLRPDEPLRIEEDSIRDHMRRETKKLDSMMEYAWSSCRRHFILKYFGEEPPFERCGTCDACAAEAWRSNAEQRRHLSPAEENAVRRILACVARLGLHASPSMVARVLSGSQDPRLLALHLERLSLYASMSSWSMIELGNVVDHLARSGFLCLGYRGGEASQRGEELLTLAAPGEDLLRRGASGHRLALPPNPASRLAGSGRSTPQKPGISNLSARSGVEDLLGHLRDARRRIAEADGVPAYVVASNRCLEAIAQARPSTRKAMLDLPGMGRVRFAKYGQLLMDALAAWTEATGTK